MPKLKIFAAMFSNLIPTTEASIKTFFILTSLEQLGRLWLNGTSGDHHFMLKIEGTI